MYEKLLSMSWEQMMNSDYYFKSNTAKHVLELPANEFIEGDNSIILLYYNVYSGEPMILLHHFDRKEVPPEYERVEGFRASYSEGVNFEGKSYGEVLYVCDNVANESN